jgi:hypothetical protein
MPLAQWQLMQTRSPYALVLALIALTSCGDDAESSGSPDGGGNGSACPRGPQAPLGFGCDEEELTCRYGYDPPACGGRTVVCRERRWQELEHTDPQLSCFDGGSRPDGSLDASATIDAGDAQASDAQASDAQASDAAAALLCQPIRNDSCTYVRSEGTATVTALETPDQGSYSCKNGAVTVRFTFVPDDPARAACFRATQPNSSSFRIGSGANPPRSCLEAANVRVGSTLRVARHDAVSGTCSPVVFTFPSSLTDACVAACTL